VLLAFTSFYLWFIRQSAKVTTPIRDLLRKVATSRTPYHLKWKWTRNAELAFGKLTRAFTDTPILYHFDPAMPIILYTDASGFAMAGIVNQYDGFEILRLVNFYSPKCTGA
jgi:hypothetical protein